MPPNQRLTANSAKGAERYACPPSAGELAGRHKARNDGTLKNVQKTLNKLTE
jgi:hypothetical protein